MAPKTPSDAVKRKRVLEVRRKRRRALWALMVESIENEIEADQREDWLRQDVAARDGAKGE